MLEEASGFLEAVSGCTEEASGYVHLPAPETTNRDAATWLKFNSNHTIQIKLGKIKSQWSKNQCYNK